MLTILLPHYLYTPEGYQRNLAVAFDETIRAVDSLKALNERFPEAQTIQLGERSILYPGFINVHVHLEFSANRAKLRYGDFMAWLHSVIEERDELLNEATDAVMEKACDEMLRSGITSFGAISSFGTELELCRRIPQRVTFFNELIGSNPASADVLYGDFLTRLDASAAAAPEDRITPAIAIHAPYSVHPILVGKAVELAKSRKLPLSTHFMESAYEREWMEKGSGGFLEFFRRFFNTQTPVSDMERFLKHFDGFPSLFVHCVHASEKERRELEAQGHSVAHCPRSNRLLGCGRLPIEDLHTPLSIATDGLSSNWSLNIFDELRAALMMHEAAPLPQELPERLLRAVTQDAASAIRSDAGRIVPEAPADFALVRLPQLPLSQEELALHTILHSREVEEVWIAGEKLERKSNVRYH